MILFIDVISPAPKFVITDNNKVIESLHILEPNCTKISDNIHASFLNLERKYNLLSLLEHLFCLKNLIRHLPSQKTYGMKMNYFSKPTYY